MIGSDGPQLGDFILIEHLGAGNMADVYRARALDDFDREVAIKVYRSRFSEDPAFRARFLHEALAVAALAHPHILPLLNWGEEQGKLYLVLPLVRGGTLGDLLAQRQGPLPMAEAVSLFLPLCQAVAYAHQQGIIHGALSPQQVLLQQGTQVFLTDFGIFSGTAAMRLTFTDAAPRTIAYMAPEQAMREADARSDLYSMGIVLYRLLTGAVPYQGSTPAQVLIKHREEPLPDPRTLMPTLSVDIVRVLHIALAKDPRSRFASVQAFASAVEQASKTGQVQAPLRVTPTLLSNPPRGEIPTPARPGERSRALGTDPISAPVPGQPQQVFSSGARPQQAPLLAPKPGKVPLWLLAVLLMAVLVLGTLGAGGCFLFLFLRGVGGPGATSTLYYQDSLTQNTGDWACTPPQCSFQRDGYHIRSQNADAEFSGLAIWQFDNFVLEVNGSIAQEGAQETALAIEFRLQTDAQVAGYVLLVSSDGIYSFGPARQGKMTVLSHNQSTAIHQGLHQQNDFKIVAQGSQFSIYANGQLFLQISDTAYSQGSIALGAVGQGTEAIFSNLTISKP